MKTKLVLGLISLLSTMSLAMADQGAIVATMSSSDSKDLYNLLSSLVEPVCVNKQCQLEIPRIYCASSDFQSTATPACFLEINQVPKSSDQTKRTQLELDANSNEILYKQLKESGVVDCYEVNLGYGYSMSTCLVSLKDIKCNKEERKSFVWTFDDYSCSMVKYKK